MAGGAVKPSECQRYGCNKTATTTCKYCGKRFCDEHAKASLVVSLTQIMNERDSRKQKILREAFDEKGGHPCPAYTSEFWRKYKKKEETETAWVKTSIKRENSRPVETVYTTSRDHRSHKTSIIIAVTIIALIIIISLFVYASAHTNLLSGLLPSPFSSTTTILNLNNGTAPMSNINQITNCVNIDLRIRVASYLNTSQVQQLINYCEYYGYKPGVVNGTNYTIICQYVKTCQGYATS